MICRYGALSALRLATGVFAVACSASAFAAELPEIKLSDANKVPDCATPGRLSAFLEARNKSLPPKFATIAADYMRIGEELGIRWDTAYFQMLLETGNLTFTGDVSPEQNNFAGLGATGKKVPGESFPDVATGVKAHLEHLLLYAGSPPENPVAERTRKVKEWGVLTSWQKTISGPMNYSHLAKKWAPGSRTYSSDIANVADSFYNGLCKGADPKPEMMALAKPAPEAPAKETKTAEAEAPAAAKAEAETPKVSGADLARRAVAEARASGSFVRSNLGASSRASATEEAAATAPPVAEAPKDQPQFKIINAEANAEPEASAAEVEATVSEQTAEENAVADKPVAASKAAETQTIKTAALGAGIKGAVTTATDASPTSSKCRVWTASYGGSRAILIKANNEAVVNYTVLDVNEGTEKREADAYIAAYAKGGKPVGEFQNQTQALDKAFELCPEG